MITSDRPDRLLIRNFAQIAEVDLSFGDLTVLVGAQGTGKSLALQWLKLAMDGRQVMDALRDAGHRPKEASAVIDLVFGAGMGAAWASRSEPASASNSKVTFDGKTIDPRTLGRRRSGEERVFYIPAHRSMLISDGWAAPFQRLTSDTPVVARMFSQNLFDRFSATTTGKLFPRLGKLKKAYREKIDESIFHGGSVGIAQDAQHARRLRLTHGGSQLPFMTWTAGQREFTPLLMGLYHLLPSTKILKEPEIDWVVIEEPEMGLHPRAISVVLLLILDLLWRGYRVVLSTHSPDVLTGLWMLRRLSEVDVEARWKFVCRGFGVKPSQELKRVFEAALDKRYRVHALAFGEEDKVRAKDISTLDPDDDDESVSGWGGLTAFSSRFGDAVRDAMNERDR
ncbi:MAG: ATP-binding protein [Deltaproteobacteria bacterium]|nr:ATP-binding protein [Deltaproteobacteria bacterium]